MQPRFLAKGGHVRPRLFTGFTKTRLSMRPSEHRINACYGPRMWHQISTQDTNKVGQVTKSSKARHIPRGTESRSMATVRTPAEELRTIYGGRDNGVSTESRSTCYHKPFPSTGLEVAMQGPRLRRTRVNANKHYIFGSKWKMRGPFKKIITTRGPKIWQIKRLSSRRRRRLRPSPPSSIARWLDSNTRFDRAALWKMQYLYEPEKSSLPIILLGYLEVMDNPVADNKNSRKTILDTLGLQTLHRTGFSHEDVKLWAHIVTAPTDEEVAQRYLSSKSRKPTFVLLEVLRRRRLRANTLRSLLIDAWDHHIGLTTNDFLSLSTPEIRDVVSAGLALPPPTVPSSTKNVPLLEYTAFTVLISRLLRHARKIWVPGVISISKMVVSYCKRVNHGKDDITPILHAKLCQIYNMFLNRLSLPASINPLDSMTYNWQAQRILLQSAAEFRPPLQLDKNSYRAVSQVLVASKKSLGEERFASLLQRTWPPWRKELDGMDVDRLPDEDISRAVATISRMKEAGYAEGSHDMALKILGGRAPGETPTIQTRRLKKSRDARINSITVEWAARITATRDIWEAWAAFQEFLEQGHQPSPKVYHAMFEKLVFNTLTDHQSQGHYSLPGDGKEVLPAIDDNISESERIRRHPPNVDTLFSWMIKDGIRPSGRFLELLISKAPSLSKVELYLRHSSVPSRSIFELLRPPSKMHCSTLTRIPDGVFAAFVDFLCRSRNRYIPNMVESLRKDASESETPILLKSNPILHALELARRRQSSSPIVWNMIISALARRRRRISLDNRRSQHLNDIMAWRLLEATFVESEEAGVQLDPCRFRYVCYGLEKALVAILYASEENISEPSVFARNGGQFVKGLFASLTEPVREKYGLPTLLHRLYGYHLHAYLRVLCLLYDTDEILVVLQWMVEHQVELDELAEQTRNGTKSLRRSLVAIRSFFRDEEYAEEDWVKQLKAVMDRLRGWGGWPTDDEVEDYVMGARDATFAYPGEVYDRWRRGRERFSPMPKT